MKNRSILFVILILFFNYCKTDKSNIMDNNTIVLKLNATYKGMVGYGYIYECKIVEVIKGEMGEDKLTLSILNSDKAHFDFLSSNLAPEEIVVTFSKNKDEEPYSIMPISGMVDKNKTSWIILKMELTD